jgi:hypothetical protein
MTEHHHHQYSEPTPGPPSAFDTPQHQHHHPNAGPVDLNPPGAELWRRDHLYRRGPATRASKALGVLFLAFFLAVFSGALWIMLGH